MSKKLFKSAAVVSSMTMMSRVLGLIRDMVFAHQFGAVAGLDAFFVAFKIPNFMRRLFAEGAFSQAFVPVLSEYRQKQGLSEVQQFVNRMAGTLFVVLLIVTVIAVLITPVLVVIFAPGFIRDPTRFDLASSMLKITFPYILLISLTAFSGSILNCYNRFAVPAFTPVLLNLALITSAIFLSPYFSKPVVALAWGVFIGGVVQLAFQLPFLKRIHLFPRPKLAWHDPGVRRVLKLMVPALFGVSVAQISLLVDTMFASFLPVGSVSWLYYSERLVYLPLGVFGVALGTVVLPHLSRKHADRSPKEFSAALDWGLRCIFVVGIPAALGLILLSGPLLTTLFQSGQFTDFAVIMSRRSLIAYGVGIPSFMLIKVLASGFYSRQNIVTPVKIAVVAVVANITLNLCLIFPLAHAGLALATALSATLNAVLLFWFLWRRGIYQPNPGWGVFALRLLFANALMVVALWYCSPNLADWLQWGWKMRVAYLLPLVGGGVLLYIVCLWVGGMRFDDFRATHLEA